MSFWQTKTLSEMTDQEWESLCDNCGKCCLHKLEDEDTGDIYFTSVACKLFDIKTCRCTQYQARNQLIPECLDVKQLPIENYHWLPSTCAYRLIAEGQPLASWHPLVSGNPNSTDEASESVSKFALMESEVADLDDIEDYVIEWLQ
jgi:hypothetical protein